jgi:hypothetical protein
MRAQSIIAAGTAIVLTALILFIIAPLIVLILLVIIGIMIVFAGIIIGMRLATFPSYDEREDKAITRAIAYSWMVGIILLSASPLYVQYIAGIEQQRIMPIIAGIMIIIAIMMQIILKRKPGIR